MTNPTMTREEAIQHARAVDTDIAALWGIYWTHQEKALRNRQDLKTARKLAAYYGARRRDAYYEGRIVALEAAYPALAEAAEAAAAEARAADSAMYDGWTRFFLVKHIHNTRHCSSFRPTTRIGWLPALSGQTEAEAVAEHGAILCTICFPSAPTEWTAGPKADPATCAGAGKGIHEATNVRRGFAAGNWAECPDCGKKVGISGSALRIPKHKKEA